MELAYPGTLHAHSEYSNLRLRDSISRIDELMTAAEELGHEVLAFTEHETISNAIKIEEASKKHPNLKVIRGNEIYLCRDGLNADNFVSGEDKYFHFILLARDALGHQQIRELSTRAWTRSWMNGKMRRVPTYYQDLLDIVASNPGHIIASTACLGGFLGTKLLQWRANGCSLAFYEKIKNWLLQIEKIFGKGNFYLEMQPSHNEEQIFVNKQIYLLSEELNIPFTITTDSHYTKKEDASIHKAFLNAQEGDREVDSFYATTYMMDTEELESYMEYFDKSILQTAYQNILNIKDKCEDYSLLKPLKIPSLKWKKPTISIFPEHYFEEMPYLKTFWNSDFVGDRRLAELVIDKLERDPRLRNTTMYDEINSNLKSTWISSEVNNAHWSAYFLNLQNVIDICWEAGSLVGPGRGSGVGFVLLYILDIIQINPVWETTKTFEWRFLNPSRVSVLDVDTDIEGSRRATVLQALRDAYGADRVAGVVTFGTEKSKSAIQTAARGLGIDSDVSLYISSLIPADRGQTRTLHQCYYGDEENDFKPIPLFVREMDNYPELWEVAQRIEGLCCRVGEHAGGIIFVDEPFTNSTGLMKVPNGDIVTQFDLHDCEAASLIKIDLLSVEALDKIHTCLDLLADYGFIELESTLRETYEKTIGIYNLERDDEEMWKMTHEHKIQALFQMEKQSGIQGIALTHPESVDDLAVLNSVIRLMAQDKDAEQPLNKYARFKNNIKLWYKEMSDYGLTKEEQILLEPIVKQSYGICESQEKFMQLVQMPECGGFDLTWADKLRKAIAKKNPKGFLELEAEYFKNVEDKNLSKNLCNYVWNVLVSTSKGYGFNASHTLAYSLVGLQEMNLAYRFPVIFWNTACLITDSGGVEDADEDGKNNNYDKIATAIGKMKQAGIEVIPPNINKSKYTFLPDYENNKIIFGLRGMINVGDELIHSIIENRPYLSPKDFLNKIKPKKQSMISLIKGGAFDSLMDRKLCMVWYLWEICDKKSRITLQNMPSLIKYNLIPNDTDERQLALRVYEFNRYLKAMAKENGKSDYYSLDVRAIDFLNQINCDELIDLSTSPYRIGVKAWDKVYQKYMDVFRNWISQDKDNILDELNTATFKEEWDKYALGSISKWEMDSLCFYYHDHELINANTGKYGIVDFFNLPEDPIVDKVFKKGDKEIKMFKLNKICGTCIAKDKNKSTVTLLTTSGVVTIKFRKEYFSIFDKQVSARQADGKKKVLEKSWFTRGNMILVQGIRSNDNFIPKKYASQGNVHQLYKISSIDNDGDLFLQYERVQGELEDEEN